jgi:hypothetical protein
MLEARLVGKQNQVRGSFDGGDLPSIGDGLQIKEMSAGGMNLD